jgi:YidC/Oxa1 family membrane protein insertase
LTLERRALIAILLSVLVLFTFRYLEERRMAEVARQQPPPAAVSEQVPPAPEEEAPPVTPPPAEDSGTIAALPEEGDTEATPKKLIIEGDLYRAVVDSQGGILESWVLNHFKSARKEPFEMIAAEHLPETRPYPGSLVLADPVLMKKANWEHYELEVTGDGTGGTVLSPPVSVIARLRRGGLYVEKSYKFEKEDFIVDLSLVVRQNGRPLDGRLLIGQDIGPEQEHLMNPSHKIVAVSLRDGKVHRDEAPKDENEVKKIDGTVRWVGLDMQYFATIAIPENPLANFEIQKRVVTTQALDGSEMTRDLLRLTIPQNGVIRLGLYVGPKQQSYLEADKRADLSGVIDYGKFSFLVRPLLLALRWIHGYVHNYGVAIILLTLILTLLLFPIRLKQMLSMKKMSAVQPKVKEIQERYKRFKKTDPRRAEMNKEIMGLYKEHNVNPLGGCLPLLLQMPLLFAFYALLGYSIELRQAPFIGWIHDLSMKDPYYVLPIVMGITQLISQRMTPMTPGADPAQAKMMMMMPVVFTIMFLNLSSGLNLYFLCSNIFQIGFQKIAERWMGSKRVATKT